jgi:hypothetical protein
LPSSHAGVVLLRRLDRSAMSLSSHVGNGATESCW